MYTNLLVLVCLHEHSFLYVESNPLSKVVEEGIVGAKLIGKCLWSSCAPAVMYKPIIIWCQPTPTVDIA